MCARLAPVRSSGPGGAGFSASSNYAMDDAFGHWLAGFTDGEGCFQLTTRDGVAYGCRFAITLRRDELPILQEIQSALGVGAIYLKQAQSVANPQASYSVDRKAECATIVDVFTRYPLRAKKRADFVIWTEAVAKWNERRRAKVDFSPYQTRLACARAYAGI